MDFTLFQQQADGSFSLIGVETWPDASTAQTAINALSVTNNAVIIAQYSSGPAQTGQLMSA